MKEKEKDGVEQHIQNEDLLVHVVYPHHPQRTTSSLFRKNHEILVRDMKLPCFKCWVEAGCPDFSELPEKAYHSLQVHHYLVEWATWNAINPYKVQRVLDAGFFDPYGFSRQMKGQIFESPDDIRNLFVLCQFHHTGTGTGIHHVDGPVWMSDMLANDNVDIIITKEQFDMLNEGKAEIGPDGSFKILNG